MTQKEFVELAEWMRKFYHNCSSDFEPTSDDYETMIQHYVSGVDSWESSSAIQEGRELDDLA